MLKSFFLFWPANVMPLWLLITLLQLKIPLITMMRSCCIDEVKHYWVHWLSSIIIFTGCILHLFRLGQSDYENQNYRYYSVFLILSAILDVISHTVKEAYVRSQPINQEKFNFQIGLFQLFIGIILFPLVKITQAASTPQSPFFGPYYENLNIFEYSGEYLKYGFICVLDINIDSLDPKFTNNGACHHSWFAILGYTLSLFLIQLTLNSIMGHKFTRHAQILQSFMVPISFFAFWLATLSLSDVFRINTEVTKWDAIGMIVVGVGVFMHNIFKEKPINSSVQDRVKPENERFTAYKHMV